MLNWLLAPLTFIESVIFFAVTAVAVIMTQVMISVIATAITGRNEYLHEEKSALLSAEIKKQGMRVHLKIAMSALGEEVIFRFIPVILAELLGYGLVGKVIASIHAAAIFGYLHGISWKLRMATGSSGLIFSLFFLKLGGAQGNYLSALLWVWLLHAGLNVFFIALKEWDASQS